jgi:hypothetical protein
METRIIGQLDPEASNARLVVTQELTVIRSEFQARFERLMQQLNSVEETLKRLAPGRD